MRIKLPSRTKPRDDNSMPGSPGSHKSPPNTPGLSSSSSSVSVSSGDLPTSRLVRVPGDPFNNDSVASFSFFSPQVDDSPAFGSFTSDNRLRVLIVGTGFAGLSAAIACARQGFSVTVLERTAGLSQHGDSIVFGSNAALLLCRWGVGAEMYERSGSKGGWWLFKGQGGEVLHEEDISGFEQQYGAPILQGRRATFLGSLGVEARMLGVSIRLESEVVGYLDSDGEPGVVLRSGETLRSDVVIVADGVHSPARELLAPHDRPASPRTPSGFSIHRAVISAADIAADPECRHLLDGTIRTWLAEDAHVCTYPMDNGRALAMTYTHRDTSHSSSINWRDKRSIDDVLALMGDGWDPILRRAIGYFHSALHWTVFHEAPAEEWISRGGRICFIGDSVHAMQPTSFQGGSQAVEDGACVALCLALAGSDRLGVPLALQTYEAIRRPRVAEAQKLGSKQQTIWHTFTISSPSMPAPPPYAPSPSFTTAAHPLRPLSFALYTHDAELYVLRNFATFAAAIDPGFAVRKEWVREGAERAEVDLRGGERTKAVGTLTQGRSARKPVR
ncbi:hypothetical protein JCM10207_009230 [Rhodosporidiobolus poonsookiae]